ncbi:MAG: transposase [Bacillota bacterium]
MPRKPRVWFPGAQYHIMSRGNHRSEIYRDEEDKQVYLSLLKETQLKYDFVLLSYCLMSNHVHLQMEIVEENPGKIMKHLNMCYAIYFNRKYDFVGHLFQGRYHAELIETDAQNLQTSKYVHLNPVRANMVEKPLEYQWSSYREYLGYEQSGILSPEKILCYFKSGNSELYRRYVENDLSLHLPKTNTQEDASGCHN